MTVMLSEPETTAEPVESARRLYCGLLNGRELAPDRFLVGGVIVETGGAGRIVLRVKDPEGIAARCWNAGYTVLVGEVAALGVIDPFGRRIDLDRA